MWLRIGCSGIDQSRQQPTRSPTGASAIDGVVRREGGLGNGIMDAFMQIQTNKPPVSSRMPEEDQMLAARTVGCWVK